MAALTARQRLALEYVAAHQPVPADELGAVLHEDRAVRGGQGHGRSERCEWCASEGRQMGAALRTRGLVKLRRQAGWVLPDFSPRRSSGYDPASAAFPEGF